MRRSLIALLGVAAVLIVVVTGVTAVTIAYRDDARSWGPMHNAPGQVPEGMQGRPSMMHGAAVADEGDFLAQMVAHHQEAVAAAKELKRSDRPRMRAFGASIVKTQSAQIELMEGWLRRWHPDQPADVGYRPMMRDLSDLSGDALDEAFLQDMIGHHMAAVMMSQQLLMRGLAQHAQVDGLAEAIRDEQHAEIFQMRQWLADWFGVGWHYPHGRD